MCDKPIANMLLSKEKLKSVPTKIGNEITVFIPPFFKTVL